MNSITLHLAGKTYDVQKLTIRANREWRKKFDDPINKLLGAAKAVSSLADQTWETPNDMIKSIGLALIMHVDDIVRVLLNSVDLITDAVFAYSPALQADRVYIESHGFDEEMVRAFMEVMQLAYPFTPVIRSIVALGSKADGISQSSPEPSGESTKTT